MKVLFAVNEENISASIVKRYQKQYKEIISYKNVYYFNAILKELQKNKTYDRIVIGEDLEEFTSSSLEQKDKFIFDRLDNISDESVDGEGGDIPIILICNDRRSKSEEILVKLFGIGVYNAIIGEDRSIDEVCRLINKPRTKKEAKSYYRINTEKVGYEKESDDNVNEAEIQNILVHFKRLGNDEKKYVESFKNINAQYNQKQMKIIVAMLPKNVKEYLDENSIEYQNIVYPEGKKIQGKVNSKSKDKNKKKTGTSEKLLEVGNKRTNQKSVVVPSIMKENIYTDIVKSKKIDVDMDEYEDEEIYIEEKPKRRGRPRKNPIVEEPVLNIETSKKRGRPKKRIEEEQIEFEDNPFESYIVEEDKYENELDLGSVLPGFEDEEEIEQEENEYSNSDYERTARIGLEIEEDDNEENNYWARNDEKEERTQQIEKSKQYESQFDDEEFERLLTNEKKVVTFIGTSKNGTSFVVNNIAQILSSRGINVAILDATQNKNAYYIYTKNDEDLRRTAINSMNGLTAGKAEGVKVNKNLTVYTSLPTQNEEIFNIQPVLETLVKNYSIVLIDCDFETPVEYFEKSQEIYLVQTMDVLTIQPLTAFLRELKVKNILEEKKIKIILNKMLRIRGVSSKNIVGGMSNYNDPEMSFMTELFNKDTAKVVAQIPFDEDVYAKYLEGLIECDIKLNGYPKEFRQKLSALSDYIYPLVPAKIDNKKNRKGRNTENIQYSNSFSSGMNNTLNNMRKRY